jgi:hypothetical protein
MSKKRKITGVIHTYSRKARENMIKAGNELFRIANLDAVASDIFSCIDELIKNAVKANYKFVLIIEKIAEQIRSREPKITEDELRSRINDIIKDKKIYDALAAEITANEEVSKNVRQVLNEESVLIRLKNKAFTEKRDFTDEERTKIETLAELESMRRELDRRNMKVRVIMEMDESFIYIEVTNNAPIMDKDLCRIYEKRDEFKNYREQGNEQEFFLNNLDTSDSGFGLGYATIDSFLAGMGLDPFRSIQIISASNTTVILSLPILPLQKVS